MGRRGFPRVDTRDAWEPAGGEGGTWVKAPRSSGTSTWRRLCVCVGVIVGWGQAVEGLECPIKGWMCIQWTAQEVLHCLFLKGNKCHCNATVSPEPT